MSPPLAPGSEWSPPTGRHLGCGWTRPNPEPHEHEADEPCSADDFCGWHPTETCSRPARQRAIFADGTYHDVCSLLYHQLGELLLIEGTYFADLVTVVWESSFDRMMKYLYREEDIRDLAACDSPLLKLFGPPGPLKYR